MNRSTLLIIFILFPTLTWGDGEILSSQHKSVEDFQSSWGKGFEHQNANSPSNAAVLGNPKSILTEKINTTLFLDKLPVHESQTQIVVAQGYAWCSVKRNGTWQLMQASLDNQTPHWKIISGNFLSQILDMKLNQDGDLSLLLSDEGTSSFHQQSILIHSGGSQITPLDPAPLAGNMDAAKQQWEGGCGNEPLLMNEFDVETNGEFLALTHSIRDSGLTVRYRISPALGQPFSIWSAPVPAGSLQIKKDGRFLQYQIIADEDKAITAIPTVSLTYTHVDSPPRKQEKARSKATPSSFSDESNQSSSSTDPDVDDNDLDSDSEKPLSNNNPQEDEQPTNDNSQNQDHDENKPEDTNPTPQRDTTSDENENSNQPNQGDQQNEQEQANTVEEADQNVKEQDEINPQDSSADEGSETSEPQQEQNQEQNDSPVQNPPNPFEPETQPNGNEPETSEPEFTSPFNHLIGKPGQPPNKEPMPVPNTQPQPQNQPNANNPEQTGNNPQSSPNDPEQPDDSTPLSATENEDGENNAGDVEANSPSPPQPGTPSQPENNSLGNSVGDSSGSPTSGGGMSNQGNGNPPPSGMPQAEGNAAGFPMPFMQNDSDGSSYKPHPSSSNGNQSRTGRSSGVSKPNKRNIASPTIASMTSAVPPAKGRISFVDEIEEKESTSNPTVPIASSAGLLTVLFWVRGKKRKSTVEVDPSEHETPSNDMIHEFPDEFTSGEKSLYTLIPKHEDSVWETAIAFDPTVLAAEINSDQTLTLHEDGTIRLEKSSNTKPEVLSLGTWQKQGITPQIMSAGLPFYALGLNINGQLNICQGKQSEKSFLEEQKPMNVPKSLHSIQNTLIKQNKLWVIGEQFNQSIALCATIEHGKVKKWKSIIPQDAPAGEIKGISTSGRDLIAYAAEDEPEVIRIYQRDAIRGGWELIAKSSYSGGSVSLSMDEKRCFMVEWFEDHSSISIHAFTRNDDGRFTGHYVNQVDLPYEAEIKSAAFQYGKLILQGKQTTPKGDTRIVSCSASILKLLSVAATV